MYIHVIVTRIQKMIFRLVTPLLISFGYSSSSFTHITYKEEWLKCIWLALLSEKVGVTAGS